MHDMSNTRKEIAARLGFAAGNGAKVSFDTYTDLVNELRRFTADSANVQYDWYTAANTWLGRKRTSGNKEIAVEANRAYDAVEREMRPKWRQSRPGAKASFGRAEDVYRLLETTPSSYNNAKKLDALATEAMRLADITPAGKDVSLHELAEMVGQDLEGDRSRASRPGEKVTFDNKQIAQGLSRLLKETGFDGMASDVLSGSSDSETLRKYVRVLKGKMSPLSGDAKSAELLSKLEKMLSARASAKTTMTREQTEEQKAGLKLMSAASPAVGAKIAKLIKEGKPQDQAVAIALDMKRRGEL
jgi:hypothetical protein